MNWTGENLRLTIFGESHGPELGVILEGVPANVPINLELLQRFLDRRAPGRNPWTSPRREADRPEFLSGLSAGRTDGQELKARIPNKDARPRDYAALADVPRPGHADYPARVKYGAAWDPSGGGPFSGRMTAPICLAGGICVQVLEREGIRILSRAAEIGGILDVGELSETTAEKTFPVVNDDCGKAMISAIMEAKQEGDSLGGIIECQVLNLPVGLGGPLFEGLESRIAELVFGIPAVKGLEFGAGFAAARLRGSENNDPFRMEAGKVFTDGNNAGGILGGMSNGMPLCFRVAMKPTPSIGKPQRSVNLRTGEAVELRLSGRHDPCVVPRAVPVVEAVAALAVYDALLSRWKERD